MSQQTKTTLTPKQRKAVVALLEYTTIEAAADSIGLNRKTIERYFTDPAFVAELHAAEGQAINQATRRLLQLADKAIDVLAGIIDDEKASIHQRRLAADAALSHLLRLRELRNVEDRLLALEEKIYGINKRAN